MYVLLKHHIQLFKALGAVQINTYCCECRQTLRGSELCIVMKRHLFELPWQRHNILKKNVFKNVPYVCHVKIRNDMLIFSR